MLASGSVGALSTVFTLLACLSFVSGLAAGPSRLSDSSPATARIALTKRGRRGWLASRLTDDDGVADLANLKNAVSAASAKYRFGAARIYSQTGHVLPGFSLGSFQSWSKLALATDHASIKKRQQATLINYIDGAFWGGKIDIGTPPQCFDVVSPQPWLVNRGSGRLYFCGASGFRHRQQRCLGSGRGRDGLHDLQRICIQHCQGYRS